jgi:hypothetical protein
MTAAALFSTLRETQQDWHRGIVETIDAGGSETAAVTTD